MGDAVEEPRGENVEEIEDVVEVFECNWNTVQAFKFSSWTIHIAPDGKFIHQDISSAELISTCVMLKIPRKEWDRILIGVCMHMIPAARTFLNNRDGSSNAQVRPKTEARQ